MSRIKEEYSSVLNERIDLAARLESLTLFLHKRQNSTDPELRLSERMLVSRAKQRLYMDEYLDELSNVIKCYEDENPELLERPK